MASKRSRTGCLTCRQRKLKCSEEKPNCAQCLKANRPCVPSSGITFRHHQNPSMNGGKADGNLKSFYGYKETFAQETQWVNIPKDLTFVHTSNPYEDEDCDELVHAGGYHSRPVNAAREEEPVFTISQAAYPAYATHGLEALSAVASDQYSYAPPQPPMDDTPAEKEPEATSSLQQNQATTSQDIGFILNPTSAVASAESNIDPRLHSQTPSLPNS